MESDPPDLAEAIVTIQRIRRVGRGNKRLVEFSDGYHVVVSTEAVREIGLTVGAAADEAVLSALKVADQRISAHEAALRLLASRARSRSEIRTRLTMRGIDAATVDAEIERLAQVGLVNDAEFARAWVTRRQLTAPRGRRMLRYELLGRGIDPAEATRVTEEVDDRKVAMEVARNRSAGWTTADYGEFAARLGGFLRRRGFPLDVASEAVQIAWKERGGEPPSF